MALAVAVRLVPAVGILVFYAWRHVWRAWQLAAGVYLGGALLIGLMLLRQVLTIVENVRLYNRLQGTYLEMEQKNDQMEQKNDQLVRSQSELRRQKEYFEALVLNSPVAIAIVDLDANVVSWNPAAERLFGYTQAEAIGRRIDDLVAKTPEMRAEVARYIQETSGDKLGSHRHPAYPQGWNARGCRTSGRPGDRGQGTGWNLRDVS